MIPKIKYSDKQFLKKDELAKIGSITYYNKFAHLIIDEGAHLGFIEMEKIHSLVSYHYKESEYAFLCDRNISYSVNPISYTTLNKIERLKCIAIIKDLSKTHDIEVERHFIKKPFKVFNTFDEASTWINTLL